MTLLNDYIIIILSPLTVFLCFCIFLFLLINLLFGQNFSIDKRQAEDVCVYVCVCVCVCVCVLGRAGGGAVVKDHRVLLRFIMK